MKKYFHLFVMDKAAMTLMLIMIFGLQAMAQQTLSVHGVVTTTDKKPLAGVTVLIAGTQSGTTTGDDGAYGIQAKTGDTLIFQSIGYQNRKVVVGSSPVINVQLSLSNKGLSEVVVLGYGTQKRRDVTAAVSTIDVSQLKDLPISNPTALLQGQAPGVTVKETTGKPGSPFQVRIRGLGSLGAGSSPLYVIDGFPVGNDIGQNLNPDDIASITILKDAVSTAIYGARGSNGVVLITTKKAAAGKTTLTATATYGVQNVPVSRRTEMLNGPEFAQFKKDIFMDKIRYFQNREPDINEVPEDFRYPEQTKYSTNWLNEVLHQNAPYQNYDVTFSEGKGDVHSLVSASYIDQQGSIIASNYKNYSVRANINGKINNFISMGLNMAGSYARINWDEGTEGRGNAVGIALLADPREPVYNEDGSYNNYIGGHDGIFGFPNPVQNFEEVLKRKEIGDVLTNGYIELSFLKHFKFKSAVNAHLNFYAYKQFVPSTIAGTNAPPPRDATENDNSRRIMNLDADQLLTYTNDFGEHHIDALAGYTAQEEITKELSGSGSQYPNDQVPFLSSAALTEASSDQYGWSMLAFFGRLNYSFKDRYLFSGTFRREGSSRFGAKNKWGNFPALSAGWRISDEPFMPKTSWLNSLKLRGSWGITGNNDIGNYTSLSFMNPSNYILGGNFANGVIISSLANPELGWEKANEVNIGLDLMAFDDKFTFTAEAYNRITTDMLLPIQLPAISGFTSTWGNVGKVQNKGLEFALGYNTRFNAVGFRANFNISFNRNKVLAIRGKNDEIWNGSFYSDYNVSKVGRPIGMIYGFKVLGIFQNQQEIDKSPKQDGAIPGVFKYYDANGDGVIEYDKTDMVEIGNPWPKATWGLTLSSDYKKFDLTVILTGAQDYDVFRQIESSTMNMDGVFNVLTAAKYRWRSEKDPGKGIWPTTNTWKWERESNSRYVHDASHAWIKNVSLGYTFPKSTLHFGSIRLYISSDNLLLITKYPGNNPDVDLRGGINPGNDDEAYPVPRTFSIGANVTF